jgi:HAD superfamily hydrolase (TIGR01509 family)
MTENKPAIAAIIFDCDGVLVDSEALALEVELAATAELGIASDPQTHMERYLGLTGAEFYDAIEREFFRIHNRPLPPDFRAICQQRYRAAIDSDRLVEIDGARDFVIKLTCAKAVASSSSVESLERKLRRTLLWDHFAPHIYSGEHVRRGKPEPDLFLHAASNVGAAPAACLVIEDSAHGVVAARRAGMRVWGFTGGTHMLNPAGEHLLDAGAERILRRWREAEALWAEQQQE